ncbi:MAG: DUF1376 domain-containing protein [Magnetococcales bacterium]|nr:DUF1376 domain-containing protein [Magnetococcales bacterium]
MSDSTEPLVSAEVDLRGYDFMPLFGARLFDSDFYSLCSDAEFRAAMILWWKAWNQVPAASLPDDDRILANLAGYGRNLPAWRKIREMALHGFVRCSDGRIYHKFLSSEAVKAWEGRLKDRDRKAKWREKQKEKDATETGTGQGHDGDRTGTAASQRRGRNVSVPPDSDSDSDSDSNKSKELCHADAPHQPQRATKGTRLPTDWQLPPVWRDWTTAEKPSWTAGYIDQVAAAFADYWHGKAGQGATKTDWYATWRNWVRQQRDPPATTRSPPKAASVPKAEEMTPEEIERRYGKTSIPTGWGRGVQP